MGTGILNLCIGLIFIGLISTHKFTVPFLGPKGSIILGAVVAAIGAFQIIRAMRRKLPIQDD